jgi:hypothetical protein
MAIEFQAETWKETLRLSGPPGSYFNPPQEFAVDLYLFNDHWYQHVDGVDWKLDPPMETYPKAQRCLTSFLGVPDDAISAGDAFQVCMRLLTARDDAKKKATAAASPPSPLSTGSTVSESTSEASSS